MALTSLLQDYLIVNGTMTKIKLLFRGLLSGLNYRSIIKKISFLITCKLKILKG